MLLELRQRGMVGGQEDNPTQYGAATNDCRVGRFLIGDVQTMSTR
ncbi:hypothetical protein GQF02_11150 [Neisseriaceae bacterium B2N2-7]|uniref:Uncharacterized protein n=1 Tax=Craterilacuibacter sinensis TaxID=2686017 RepID=A0A845BYF2_9NEIS|nr:hypothetical protein [Craterilacuibacter sinensis]